MQVYTLTNSNEEEPELFVLGEEDSEAVVLFSDVDRANTFIADFDLADEFSATPVTPIELPQLMVDCNEQNVPFILVNPTASSLDGDAPLRALNVAELLTQFGNSLAEYVMMDEGEEE